MKPVPCPKCGAEAVSAEDKPWCPQCGWNRDVAFHHLRRKLRDYRNAMIVGPLFIYAGVRWWLEFPWWAFFAASGFWILVALLSFLTIRKELKKFQTISPSWGIKVKPSSSASIRSTPKPQGERSEPLEISGSTVFYRGKEIPVGWPRRIRLARKTKVFYGLMVAVLAYMEGVFVYLIYQRWEKFTPGDELPWGMVLLAVLSAFVLLCAWLLPRRLRRHRGLLTTGEMALARVTGQRIERSGDSSDFRITYKFKDPTGQVFSGEDTDQTENFYEGMVVPVVYERGNPKTHLVLCSTDYEVLPAYFFPSEPHRA